MKFYCDRCNAKYSIADEKVRGKIVKVRCKRCGDIITVSEEKNRAHQSTPDTGRRSQTSSAPNRTADGTEWYYSVQGETYGPIAEKELAQKYRSGDLTANSYVWRDSFGDWKPAGSVEPFGSILDDAAESVPGSQPSRKNTMGVGDSIEAVEPAGGSTVVTERSGVQQEPAESGGGSRRGAGAESSSATSRSARRSSGDRTSSGDGRRRSTSGRGGSRSRRRSRGERRGLSRESSEARSRSEESSRRSRRDRSSRDDSGDSSADDGREDRLNRLREKLKSDFGSGSRSSRRRRDESDREPQAQEDDQEESAPGRAQTPSPDRAETPAPEARSRGSSGTEEADRTDSGPASANDILSDLQPDEVEDETTQMSREDFPDIEEEEEDEGAFDLESAEAETAPRSESRLPSPGQVEQDEEASSPEESAEESEEFSLPPPGSSRLGEDRQEGDEGAAAPEARSEGEAESEEAAVGESKPELPTAPKLGTDEAKAADESGSMAEGMTQSLLIQLDKMKKENRGHRWIGGVAAAALLLLGGGIGYYLWTNAGTQDAVEPESDEPKPMIAASDDDGAERKTYSEEEQERILALSPQKVDKEDENKGAGEDSEKGASEDQVQTDRGSGARGNLTADGPTMEEAFEGAKRREKNERGVQRNVDEGSTVSSSSGTKGMSEPFEAMQAIEGSSPSIESPTDSLDPRGSGSNRMKLTKQQIREGIQGVRSSVGDCRARHHRRGAPLDAKKIYLTLSVEPSGSVSGFEISPARLEGSVLERCLSSHTGRWGFGPFQGGTQKIKAPFIMQ